ncbi:hypothetical protein ACET3Z_000059 [Daucus carota]
MDPEYVVLDESSDEDVGLDEKVVFDDSGEDDCDWIQELLKEVDRQTSTEDSDESDDVVLVSEVVVSPKSKLKNSDTGLKDLNDEEDDDDCVVLDGDPDKPEAVENNQLVDESDELQVVAETGQVACRDYPHPRHLCAKYQFTSTAHETHCSQCHCYVCDLLAPCLHWDGNHCHATDKEEYWKNERKSLKNRHQAAVSVPRVYTSLSAEMIPISQGPVSVSFEPTYVPSGQVPGPATIRACSWSTNFAPGFDHSGQVPRNRFRPNLVLQHLRSTDNDLLQRDRRHTAGNAALQVKSPPSVFKRTGGGPLLSNRRYCLSNQTYRAQYMSIPPQMPIPVHNNSMRWQPLFPQLGPELNTYQLPPQPNIHANFSNPLPYQPQLSSTPNVMNNHMNMMPSQPMVSPPSSTANFFVSSVTEHQVPTQAYHYGNTFLRPSQSQLSLQPIVDNSYTNRMPSEPLIYGQLNAAPNEYQNVNLNQDHSFLGSTEEDIDLSCINLTSESNQEPTPQHQDIGLVTEHEALPRTEQEDDLFGGSPNLDALNFQYDSWNLGSSDKPVHSPEPDISDSSFFFGL